MPVASPLRGLLAALSAVLGLGACASSSEEPRPEPRVIDPQRIVDYRDENGSVLRFDSARDVLPGGLSAAMLPVFIDWDASVFGPGGHVVLYNVNHDGNPLSGVTVFRRVRFELAALRAAEFTSVPLTKGGRKDTVAAHGQLRFLFSPPGRVDGGGGGEADVPDLVLSWEAWRPPGGKFSVIGGMDPERFRLSMRAYSGAQRFLEDALGGRDWYSYPLDLPGGEEGLRELLEVALVTGDGVARRSFDEILERSRDEWLDEGPADARAQWRDLLERSGGLDAHRELGLGVDEEVTYQTLLRSCVTMSLHSLSSTVARLQARGVAREVPYRVPPDPVMQELRPWMADIGSGNVGWLFARAPYAARFVVNHPASLPNRIPELLEEAGLLEMDDGEAVVHHYSVDGDTPYGPARYLLLQ